MSHFTEALSKIIGKNDKANTQDIVLAQIPFQKIQLQTKRLLESFSFLTVIKIVDCDLRTLENFPVLPLLTEVHLTQNKLQGSLQNIQQLNRLKYIDLSSNLIVRSSSLSHLQKFPEIVVCVANNPFLKKQEDWKTKLKNYKLTIEDKPRSQNAQSKNNSRVEIDLELKQANSLRRQQSEERTFQRPLEALISMTQSITSNLEASFQMSQARADNRMRGPPRRPYDQSAFDYEDFAPRLTRTTASSFQAMISPRQLEEQRAFFLSNDSFQPDLSMNEQLMFNRDHNH